ncbi:MAG: HNH endonuclease [Bacteroidales bacterium]|nr:HNH endonuclease [Bacteroidales bacterium]
MRPIVKTEKFDENGSPLLYNPWTSAKQDLVDELGDFCSYCEKQVDRSSLSIDHIHGIKTVDLNGIYLYDNLKFRWDNFLLACKNCNSIKGIKDIEDLDPFMPHLHNLLFYIEIGEGGMIFLKADIAGKKRKRAQTFINLIGLDRSPGHPDYSSKDDRWEYRLKAFDIASRYKKKYLANPKETDVETICRLAGCNGFFSVWYYIFKDYPEVVKILLNGYFSETEFCNPFRGTSLESFDLRDYHVIERI